MLKISEIIQKTEDMFDLSNAHFYNNGLIRPAITVSPGDRRLLFQAISISVPIKNFQTVTAQPSYYAHNKRFSQKIKSHLFS